MNKNFSFDPSSLFDMITDVASEKVAELTKSTDYIPTLLENSFSSLDDDLTCDITFEHEKTGEKIVLHLIDNFSNSSDDETKIDFLNQISKSDLHLKSVEGEKYSFEVFIA